MSETLRLPVLPLDDSVVLPTMVVPLDTSATEASAAIQAAQMSAAVPGASDKTPQVLLVPRLNGKYPAIGTLGAVEQTGRLPSGEPAAVIRGLSRVRIGVGTTGPGAALWVEGTVIDEPPAWPAPRNWPVSTAASPARSCRSAGHGRSSTCCSGSPTRPRWRTAPATPGT